MHKRYKVVLTPEERASLRQLTTSGKAAAATLRRARILLKADQGPAGPAWADTQISEAVEVAPRTVERVRHRCVEEGLETALRPKPRSRPPRSRKLDGAAEAQLIALACSAPPEGRTRWTLQLLADQLVVLQVVDGISDETVRRTLKKRPQAVVEKILAHSSKSQHCLRGGDGRHPGSLPAAHVGCTPAGVLG